MDGAKRRRNFVKVGAIKVPWSRYMDGRTAIDFRSLSALPAEERKLRTFTDHEEALRVARGKAIELHNGGAESQVITAADRAALAHASQTLQTFGVDLPHVVTEWSRVTQKLNGSKFDLDAAVAAGMAALQTTVHATTDVVFELLSAKRLQDLDQRYERDLRSHMQSFAAVFPGDIARITPLQIETWLDGTFDDATKERLGGVRKKNGQRLGSTRRNHVLENIVHLFKFARARGYLPDKITAAQQVAKIKTHGGEVEIFTTTEIQTLFDHIEEQWLPWLAIAAFSGIRAEEVAKSYHAADRKDPLRWEDFDWTAKEINVRGRTAKTGKPRRCPISDNLMAWLAPWRDSHATGPVAQGSVEKFRKRFKRRLEKLKRETDGISSCLVEWPHNALRHSYGSYRMAAIHNMHQLAYEMGTSVSMIQLHYHNPRSPAEAAQYFGIAPSSAPNVIQLSLFSA